MRRAPTLRRVGRTAGTVILGLILLDLVAGAAALVFGVGAFRR